MLSWVAERTDANVKLGWLGGVQFVESVQRQRCARDEHQRYGRIDGFQRIVGSLDGGGIVVVHALMGVGSRGWQGASNHGACGLAPLLEYFVRVG